jgi:dihydroorotate dehydrogenase electron transfer subunit
MPYGCIACMPLLDQWGIASRLASLAELPGCFEGLVTDLAQRWLEPLTSEGLAEVEVFACGSTHMLESTMRLARHYGVPWQVLPEELASS